MSKNFHPMLCPVCSRFYFSALQEGDAVKQLQCHCCGWRYDLRQAQNPKIKKGANALSLNEYKAWYAAKIEEDPAYDYLTENEPDSQKHRCPVCGRFEFQDRGCFDICPYCGWEDDDTENSTLVGANGIPFSDYQKRYYEYVSANPNYRWQIDGLL